MNTEDNNTTQADIKADFRKEMEMNQAQLMDPGFKRKKLIVWCIRTILATVLYVWFWHITWVKWSLLIYIPLNVLGLFFIIGGSYLLKRKMDKVNNKIDAL